jgi:hypothetical protein
LGIVALVGCGRGAPIVGDAGASDASAVETAPDATAATRLRPWSLAAEGAPPLVVGIYDTQEKAHCRFLPDEAGQLRCLPTAVVEPEGAGWFSDAACTKRVYRVDPLQARALEGRPVAVPLPRTTCAPRRYRVVTLKVRDVAPPHFGGSPCGSLTIEPDPLAILVEMEVTGVVAPERWEAGTEATGARLSPRLFLWDIETTDGAFFQDHFVDEHWGHRSCRLENAEGGDVCAPARLDDITLLHEDDACKGTPVWRAGACEDPAFIGRFTKPFHALGAKYTGAAYELGKGCRLAGPQTTAEGSDLFYELGEPLGDDALAPVAWKLEGTGRLQLRGLVVLGGFLPVSLELARVDAMTSIVRRYHDTVTNADCDPLWTPEGRVRCVPTDVVVNPYSFHWFADAACTKTAYLCGDSKPCGGQYVVPFSVDARGELRADELVKAVDAPEIFTDGAGACVPMGGAFAGYTLGDPLPWDVFPELVETNGRASGAP